MTISITKLKNIYVITTIAIITHTVIPLLYSFLFSFFFFAFKYVALAGFSDGKVVSTISMLYGILFIVNIFLYYKNILMEEFILLVLFLFFTCNVNNENTYLFFFTFIILILNFIFKKPLFQYLSIAIMIGGLFISRYNKLYFHKLLEIQGVNTNKDLIINTLDLFLHIIIPLIFIKNIKKHIRKEDFLNGLIIIISYITLVDTEKYYYLNKETSLLLSVIVWSFIYIIFKQ